jgi:hypothetical protein
MIRAQEQTNFLGSISTVRRRIRASELNNRSAANKPFLTASNKRLRLEFAHQFVDIVDLWNNIIFSDEKTFQSCHNGRLRVYRSSGQRYDERYIRDMNRVGRFSVNIWGWISIRGPGVCAVIEDKLTAPVYCRVLDELMLPSVRPIFGDDFVFQQASLSYNHQKHVLMLTILILGQLPSSSCQNCTKLL